MKSYLQRLAARAEGHALTASIIPAARNEIRESEPDPFAAALESDESAAAQSSQAGPQVTSNDAQVTSALQYSSQTVEPPAGPVSSTARSRRARRSRAGEAPEQAIETQPVSPKAEGAARQREMSSREIDSPAISEGEPRRSRAKTRGRAEPAKTQRAGPDEARRPNSQAQDVSQQVTPRGDASERSAPASPRAIRADVTAESSPALEPRRADAVTPAAPIPDEPRLVIGQLRVDVVAAAPAETREVVRVVTRTVGSGRSSNSGGPLSKLRFGLGQM